MSIRTNPMKAVPLLLKQLMTVEKHAELEDLESELIKIKDIFSIVKKNEEELLDTLTVLHGYLRNSNIHKLMEEKDDICKRIRISTQKLLPACSIQSSNIGVAESSGKTFQDVELHKREKVHRAIPSSQLQDLEMFVVNYKNLRDLEKRCLLSLLLFPENTVLKKNNIILWWRWIVQSEPFRYVFNELRRCNFIVPYGNDKCPIKSKFKINPLVHHKSVRSLLQIDGKKFCGIYSQIMTSSRLNGVMYDCLALDQHKVKLRVRSDFKFNNCRAVFNVGASYLNFEPRWMAKMKYLEVLQLGRWLQDSNSSHHIEVTSEEFLKELRDQSQLKYLSLRGISRISELPLSIFQLESLETLDLKACHNLETLPNDIASLRNLRHLNLSQCYLLERMPKGIEKLTELKVLKGFLIGSSTKTPCRISDLAFLKYLKRLSIHIGSEAVIQDREFERLKSLSSLEHLKISWGVYDTRYSDVQIIFPSTLKKLHLECFPGQIIPEWLKPSKLLSQRPGMPPVALTELNITGGKLISLDHGENNSDWSMKIVRLKYLKHLQVDSTNLQKLFPSLIYVEIKQILTQSYFEWSIS